MKKLLLLVLPLLAVTLNSCSKDDGGETGGENTKLVKKIIYADEYDYYSFEFTYDSQSRITKITEADDAEIGTYPDEMYFYYIAYNDNQITITYSYSDKTTVMTLDDNGYVTRQVDHDGIITTHEYSNGNIAKSTYGDYTQTYTWVNGNLTKAEEKYNIADYTYTYTYTYGNVENKMNIDPFFMYFYVHEFLLFKGTKIKNLPTSYKSIGETTFTYTFDNDGYPTKIIETDSDGSQTITITYY